MSNEQIFNSGKAEGKTKEKADQMMDSVYSAASDTAEVTQQKGEQIKDKTKDMFESAKHKGTETKDEASSFLHEKGEHAKDVAKSVRFKVPITSQEAQHESEQATSFLQEKGEEVVNMASDAMESVMSSAIGALETVKSTLGIGEGDGSK